VNGIKLFFLAAPILLIGCGSQSEEAASAAAIETTTTIGNATNTTSETNAFPNRTVPDIDSMTLVVEKPNLRARGWAGVSTSVTVFVGDNLNDKTVLDGVTVNFSTEGGRIDPSCSISDGSCSVTWNSQLPAPVGDDGRVTVVAWMSGAESFKDLNANGLFDDGDLFADVDSRPDLTEPYLNDNKYTFIDPTRPAYLLTGTLAALNNVNSSTVKDASESFFDTPGLTENVFDGQDGKYSGPSCAHSTLCSPTQSIFIWRETEIITSGGSPKIEVFNVTGGPDTGMTLATSPIVANTRLRVEITDGFNNVLPADATVEISSTKVNSTTFSGAVGASRFPSVYFINVLSDGTSSTDGEFKIEVNVPADGSLSSGQNEITQTLTFVATD
jgi:hypothetical protein